MNANDLYYMAHGKLALRELALARKDLITDDVRDALLAKGLRCKNQAVMAGIFLWGKSRVAGPLIKSTDRLSMPRTAERREQRHDRLPVWESLVFGKKEHELPPPPPTPDRPRTLFDVLDEQQKAE